MTAVLLVAVLVSLEQRSPVHSAAPETSSQGGPSPQIPPLSTPDPTADPGSPESKNRFTFYENLPKTEKEEGPESGRLKADLKSGSPGPDRERGPSSVSKSGTVYTVQVAAHDRREAAETMARHLKRKGYPAFVIPHVIPDRKTWYRVRVGQYRDLHSAQLLAAKLKKGERLDPFIATE